jgi:hypothetical protein
MGTMIVVWLVGRSQRFGAGRRVALVWTAAGLYGGLVLVLTWQALRGQPLVAPDAATLGALGGPLAAAAITAGAILQPSPLRRADCLDRDHEGSAPAVPCRTATRWE